MSNRRYPPAFLRYLKARLWNLTRPAVWGTTIFLSVVGLVTREYFVNPNFLSHQPQEQKPNVGVKPGSDISAEDKAIAADIDNLPVLLSDGEKAALATVNTPVVEINSKDKRKNPLEEAIKNQKTNLDTPKTLDKSVTSDPENPFITQANDLLKFRNSESENQQTGSLSQTNKNVGNQSENSTLTTSNALKTAIDKNNSITTPSNQTNNFGQSSSTSYSSNQSSPNQSFSGNGVNSTPQNNYYQSNTTTPIQNYSTNPSNNINNNSSNNFSNPTSSTPVTSTSNPIVPAQSSGFTVPNSSVNTSGYGNSTLPQQTETQQYNAYPNSQRLPGQ
jgi:hypothetical protein